MAKHRLTYLNLERFETEQRVIDNLTRKGWIDHGVFTPPPPSPEELEVMRKDAIEAKVEELIDSIAGSDIRSMLHKVVRALRRTRKEAKGQATQEEVDELDQLTKVGLYSEQVREEGARLIADTNLTVNDANWPAWPPA